MIRIDYCTRCKKPLDSFWCEVTLASKALRLREDSTIEEIENSKFVSSELLCPDCFSKFCDVIESEMQINKESDKEINV